MTNFREMAPLSAILNEPLSSVKDREANTLMQLLQAHENRVVLFGGGGLGRNAIANLRKLGITPQAVCDNNKLLWGSEVSGIPIISVAQAASSFGQSSLFLVAVWNPHHWFGETSDNLKAHGVRSVVSYLPMYWRFPLDFLQVYLFNDLPSKVYQAGDDVIAAEKLWADETSLDIYRANIYWRALGNTDYMPPRPIENTYFPPDIFVCEPHERIIDCGAFDGDTIKQILSRCGENLDEIYALEGDAVTFNKLQSFVASLEPGFRERIRLIHGAVGGRRAIVRFTSDGGTGSHMDSGEGDEVQCYPLDSIDIAGPVTMIKMDIEGAEYDSILGAQAIILRDKPLLAVCVYHMQQDIWRIPLLIHDMLPEHKLYLRAYEGDGFQTVMYAVPRERSIQKEC